MRNITYNQGESHLLASYFQSEPPAFGPFYVGLGTGGAFLSEAGTLADLNEISEPGYVRAPIARDNTVAGWELRGDMVQSPELLFPNTDPLNDWGPVDFAFLTLSQAGSQEPNVLIAAVEFPKSLVVNPGDSLKVIFRFRAVTNGPKFQRIAHAGSSVSSQAGVSAIAVVI
jgi:hypothetical protein